MEPIEAALKSLESLNPGETPNYTAVAKKYKVHRSTLSRRHRGLTRSRAEKTENKRLLTLTQEKELVEYIDRLCARGLPPLRQIIRNFATEIAGREAGKCWPERFLERYNIDLVSR